MQKFVVRRWLLDEGKRVDGSGINETRQLAAEVGILPRVHGSGTITPDVMQEALEAYQRVYRQYDASSINDIPVEVFYKELARYRPFVNNAKEAFADPKTGMAPGVMGLTAEDMQNFYSQLPKRLESVIWLEQSEKPGYEQAQAIAQKRFDAVQKPFTYSFGVSPDAMDYQTLLSLLLTLLCAVIAAPVFASRCV